MRLVKNGGARISSSIQRKVLQRFRPRDRVHYLRLSVENVVGECSVGNSTVPSDDELTADVLKHAVVNPDIGRADDRNCEPELASSR